MGSNAITGIEGRVMGGVSAGLYRKPPWHGVGEVKDSKGKHIGEKRQLNDDVRHISTIKILAGLEWEPRSINLSDLVEADQGRWIVGTNIQSDRQMLVRDNFPSQYDAYDLGVHSGKYGVITNDQGLSFAEEIMKHRSDAKLRSVTTLYGGRIVFAVLEFHDGVDVTRRNGEKLDKNTKFMGIYWSHDGSHPLGVKYMRNEWVCENTFTPWNAETGLVVRHTVNAADRASDALRAIEGMMKSMDEFDLEIQRLTHIPLLKPTGAFVRDLIGQRPQEKVTAGGKVSDRGGINWDKQFEAMVAEMNEYTDATSAFDFVMAVQGYEQHRQPVRGGGRDVKTITRLMRDDFPLTKAAAGLFA